MKHILEPGSYYHIYNHSIGSEKLFLNEGNYDYFKKKYQKYINPIAATLAFCLLPNHFHFLIKTRKRKELKKLVPKSYLSQEHMYSRQFSKLFSCYTQSFNRQQIRMGSLFMKNFKRKKANDPIYLRTLIEYIHFNPIKHKLCSNINEWKHSSFIEISNGIDQTIDINELI